MTKHKKLAVPALSLAVLAGVFAAALAAPLKSLDVVGNGSAAAFAEILAALPEGARREDAEDAGWSLTAPDGSSRFLWSPEGVALEVDARPFLAAGLSPSKLPAAYAVAERNGAPVLTVAMRFKEPASASADASALEVYAAVADTRRDHINYHSFLDHYGVMAGGGNMFEWAKDMRTNGCDGTVQDKDIVFALNPAPLAAAGAETAAVAGWLHAQVPVMAGGSTVLEWNLLKPFDLK